jgi:hypothetical protein
VIQEENSSKQGEYKNNRQQMYSQLRKSKVKSLIERKNSTGNISTILENKIIKKTSNGRLINLPSRNMNRVEQSKGSKEALFSSPPLAPKFFKAESKKWESNKNSNEGLGLPNYNNYNNIVKLTEYIKKVFVARNTTRSTKDINCTIIHNNHINDISYYVPQNNIEQNRDRDRDEVDEFRLSSLKSREEDNFSIACEKINNRSTPTKGSYTTRNMEPKVFHKQMPVPKKPMNYVGVTSGNRIPAKRFRITKRVLKMAEFNNECNVINDFHNNEKIDEDINDKLHIQEGENINLFPLLKVTNPVFGNSLAVHDVFIFI